MMHFQRARGQDIYDGMSERDAARLRAFLGHSESKSPRAGDKQPTTQSANRKRGVRA